MPTITVIETHEVSPGLIQVDWLTDNDSAFDDFQIEFDLAGSDRLIDAGNVNTFQFWAWDHPEGGTFSLRVNGYLSGSLVTQSDPIDTLTTLRPLSPMPLWRPMPSRSRLMFGRGRMAAMIGR